jgi:cobalt/nickel transport system permease protein
MKRGFIERTLAGMLSASQHAATAEQLAGSGGALQTVDPRVKVTGLFALVFVTTASRNLQVIAAIFALAIVLAIGSRVSLLRLAKSVWLPVLFFTGAIALPAVFLSPGRAASFLIARAETAATLSALLVLTTPWPWVLKALRTLRCPVVLVTILGMTYRYIFVILQIAFEMFESRKSRTVGVLEPAERRRLATAAVGVLLSKSIQLSGDVHLAMQSRGFRGEVFLLHDFRARAADWFWMGGFLLIAAAGFWWGRA